MSPMIVRQMDGPMNAMDCAILRTFVRVMVPDDTSLSAMGPTNTVMATVDAYGSSEMTELLVMVMPRALEKNEGR